jgi:hypothetical protein
MLFGSHLARFADRNCHRWLFSLPTTGIRILFCELLFFNRIWQNNTDPDPATLLVINVGTVWYESNVRYFSLGYSFSCNGKSGNKKTIRVVKGTPLPYTLSLYRGACVFVINPDLSVSFNGERYFFPFFFFLILFRTSVFNWSHKLCYIFPSFSIFLFFQTIAFPVTCLWTQI